VGVTLNLANVALWPRPGRRHPLELEARVADLRGKSFENLLSLPEARTDQLEILGKRVTFTVFRERQDDGT
jgi:hypothetical protein